MSLHVQKFLGTAINTTVGTTATQLFATPERVELARTRTGFLIANNDATSTDVIYVSNTEDVTATNYWYAILPSDPQPQYIPWDIGTEVWIIGSTSSVTYRAQEVIADRHL